MARDAGPLAAGGTAYIKRGEEVPFDDSRFKPGDEVGAYITNRLQGDRADIRVAVRKDGVHTSVVARKLVTGSKFDVQFSDLRARYPFGFAAFDNAQVRHATRLAPRHSSVQARLAAPSTALRLSGRMGCEPRRRCRRVESWEVLACVQGPKRLEQLSGF